MTEPDPRLLDRAAGCYLLAGETAEAARCYRDAGSHRRAADLYVRLDRYREAATEYAKAGLFDIAGWYLVHYADDPAAARAEVARTATGDRSAEAARRRTRVRDIARVGAGEHVRSADPPVGVPPAADVLRRRLVLARCDVAEQRPDTGPLRVLAETCAHLERAAAFTDPNVEAWAVALSDRMNREDQAALVFAAAVRGRRHDAAERWAAWSRRVLQCELILPAAEPDSAVSGSR